MIMNDQIKEPDKIKIPERIQLVGVGGMGVNALRNFSGDDFPPRIAIDTDGQVLLASGVPKQVQLAPHLAHGQSCGGSVELGRRCANGDVFKLREMFVHAEQVILFAGLGGGLGSGAAPIIAQTAKDEGALVICIVTKPFDFEGEERMQVASKSLDQLRQASHAVIVMPNDYLIEGPAAQRSLTDAFRFSNQQIGSGLQVLWQLLAKPTLINLDFHSLKHMLENSEGDCTFLYSEGHGEDKARRALERVLAHPAVKQHGALRESTSLLLGVLGSPDMSLSEMQEVMSGITDQADKAHTRFVGAGVDDAIQDSLRLFVLMSSGKQQRLEEPGLGAKPGRRLVKPVSGVRTPIKVEQEELDLNAIPSKGRFKDVEPTIYEGEDLDLPTFIRRGMRLSR